MIDLDIEKICRVCLKTGNDLLLLFDEQNAVNGISLPEMISEITIYKVRRYDEFPHLICTNCLQRVKNAYEVKKEFETSHRKLITYLESINVKVLEAEPDNSLQKSTQTEESALYPCEKCVSKFMSYEKLRDHRNECHRGTANECRLCSKSFNRIGDLKCHISVAHPEIGLKAHECELCGKKFTRKEHARRHMRTVHKFNEHPIEECEMVTIEPKLEAFIKKEIELSNLSGQDLEEDSFGDVEAANFDDSASSIADDFVEANPLKSEEEDDEKPLSFLLNAPNISTPEISTIETFKCEPNDNDTSISTELLPENRPKVSFVPFKPQPEPVPQIKYSFETIFDGTNRRYKCNECEKTFTRNCHVKRHILSHSEEKPYPCTECDKRFSRLDHLKIHMDRHLGLKPFKCDCCHKAYCRMDLLKEHKDSKHGGEQAKKTDICPVCNKSFCSKAYLRKHMRRHTEKGWTCKQCPMQFDNKPALQEHNKTHEAVRPYLCSECGLSFLRADYLRIHMRRHTGEKPYACKFCGKGFPRATDLNVHERYHLNVKTHLCTICGKGFSRGYNLVVHMRVHTGEKPYKCPHCPKSFAQCNDMKSHIRRHTGERYKCEVCSATFVQGYHLTQHKLSVHGIEVESRIKRLEKILPNQLGEGSTLSVKEELLSKTDEITTPELELQL